MIHKFAFSDVGYGLLGLAALDFLRPAPSDGYLQLGAMLGGYVGAKMLLKCKKTHELTEELLDPQRLFLGTGIYFALRNYGAYDRISAAVAAGVAGVLWYVVVQREFMSKEKKQKNMARYEKHVSGPSNVQFERPAPGPKLHSVSGLRVGFM